MCTSVSCRFQCLKSSLMYLRENGQLKFSSSLYLNDIITSVTSKHNAFQNISYNEYLKKKIIHLMSSVWMLLQKLCQVEFQIELHQGHILRNVISHRKVKTSHLFFFIIIFSFQDSMSSNLVNNYKQHLSIERTRKKLPSVIWFNRIYTK